MDKKNHEGSFKKAYRSVQRHKYRCGMVIGSGVYYLGSYVLERTGMSLGWSLVAWVCRRTCYKYFSLCFA